ncbi:ABC transporter permease [Xylanimonas ulmi]|uniref:ABC-type lipoprotein release transport system permease subunit n=1 Tax=Xylanimonas ulmi TaxID=228973 RepID=A0A4Q7M4T5_9MICO|nr:ABC transporter permease [Xylanibacterium ulmi]RZS61947.1 ABC-type lipoprotein release transport system permease subunit [Xylanibacterium ulmi]
MFLTYLRRELRHRRKQTVVVATGLGVAIALVMVVSSFASGVERAQSDVLASVYGVGTDITVNQAADFSQGDGPRQRFDFGEDGGSTDADGATQLTQSRLTTQIGSQAFDASALDTVAALDHVTGVSATLSLQNTEFSGELPQAPADGQDQQAGPPADGDGGGRAFGGGAFGITQVTVSGVDPSADAVGPLTTVVVADGRGLAADDADADVAVLDQQYATQNDIAVGDTVTIGGTDLEVVGVVASSSGEGVATSSNVYMPLAVAQTLSDQADMVTDLYVSVDSSSNVDAVKDAIAAALPDASVSTQADLAGDVSGSLATASSLISKLGLALSIVVLVAAFGLAILFTVSGVNRRTRELGTLKAIGWPRRRVVGQVAGEAVAQGAIGGVTGVILGGVAVLAINLAGITLSGGTGGGALRLGGPGAGGAAQGGGQLAGGAGGAGGPFGAARDAAASTVDVVLHAPVSVWIVVAAVGLAILGGLVAGVFGGRRAARLRPAEALRSLA